jgi:hypothetical protein
VHDFERNLVGLDFLERLDNGLDRALRVGLDDDLEHLALRRFERGEQIFQRDLRAVFQILAFRLHRALFGQVARGFFVLHHAEFQPASGTPFKPSTLHRDRRPGFLEPLAFLVDERADRP